MRFDQATEHLRTAAAGRHAVLANLAPKLPHVGICADQDDACQDKSGRDMAVRSRLRAVIEHTVAGVFDVDVELLDRPTRGSARVALARQVAMYMAHVSCAMSLTEVGDVFSRDRTTVAHACTIVEQRRDEDSFDKALELVELVIRVLIGPRCAAAARRGS